MTSGQVATDTGANANLDMPWAPRLRGSPI